MATTKSVYEYTSYKLYLAARLGKKGARTGLRSAIAKAADCNTTYVSQVLNGSVHFSLEQAEKISRYLGHNSEEMQFFLLLVQYDRAGTKHLRDFFSREIAAIHERRQQIHVRLGIKQILSQADQATYYSAWYYAAIHVALSIPALQNKTPLAHYFNLPMKKVNTVLSFLESVGLALREGERYCIGPTHIHLDRNSENILRHHTNWRMKSMLALEQEMEDDLHYSAAVTLSQSDARKIKEILLESLKRTVDAISASKEEAVYGLAFDFFSLQQKTHK